LNFFGSYKKEEMTARKKDKEIAAMGGLHFGAWHISMRAQCFSDESTQPGNCMRPCSW
jgi:hypothetical protein